MTITVNERRFSAARGIGERVGGLALIATVPFSARYDLDRTRGTISRTGHPLFGSALKDRILIFPAVEGGVAGAWAFLAMAAVGVGPAALVFGDVNPVMVQGAVAADLPILSGIDPAVFSDIRVGDYVVVDPTSRSLILPLTSRPPVSGTSMSSQSS